VTLAQLQTDLDFLSVFLGVSYDHRHD
jgi:hypothetical protein